MADDVIVSNAPTSVNPDIDVRTTETTTGKHIQHMRLDIGTGTAESVVDVANPLPVIVDANQPAFPILNEGEVIASNSSTVPLGAGASFTGAAFEVLNYAVVNVCVYADVPSATDGVKVEWSPDGINWDHAHRTTYSSATGVGYIFNCEYKYARVVYTNGATAQTVFRLQTIVKTTRVQSSLYTLSQTVSGNMFAELVKAELIAKNPSNTWVAINCTAGGNLKVSVEEFDGGVFGQATMANSLPVVIASDQTAVDVKSTNLDIRDLTFATDTVDVSGSSVSVPGVALETGGNLASVKTNTDNLALAQGATTSGQKGNLVFAAATTSEPTYTTGQSNPLSLTLAGRLRTEATQSSIWSVRNQDGAGNALTSKSVGSARAQDVAIVDGSGNQITSFGGGTEYTEDVAAPADPIGKATVLVRADTPSALVSANGDNVVQRGTNYGAAYVQIVSSSGSFVDSFGGGTQYADGAAAATPTGNQINWNESGTQRGVSLSKALPVQPGTGSVFDVEGNVASDGVDSGNPVKIGAIGKAYGTTVTVGADDRTDLRANRLGLLHTICGALNTQTVNADYGSTAQTNTAIISTTTVLVITRITVTLSYATSTTAAVRIGFGASSTPTTTAILEHEGIVPGSIITIGDGSGIVGVGAAGEDLRITSTAATDGSLNVSVTYFEVAS